MTTNTTQARFLPERFEPQDWDQVEPYFDQLLRRPVRSADEFESWIRDRGELAAAIDEAYTNLHIAVTCDTEDARAEADFTRFVEHVMPRLKPADFDLDKREARLSGEYKLPEQHYFVHQRSIRNSVELFREQNVDLETELTKTVQRFDKISGAQTVEFLGKERTLPQMTPFLQETDRSTRESAWRAVADRRMQDRETLDALLDQQIELRHTVAKNAGFEDHVAYKFRRLERFDYTPDHCRAYHEACRTLVVPMVNRFDEQRKADLGLDTLRPWDTAVDPKGREPLRPFRDGRELYDKTAAVIGALDPRLHGLLASMGPDPGDTSGELRTEFLDLDTRKGKRPGGYQTMRPRSKKPFIFMNAAGVHRDVRTMIHEAGHAFHSILAKDQPLLDYQHAPIEFCEVASMAMELLTIPHWNAPGGFYPDREEYTRAVREHFEEVLGLLPWIASIDKFQIWMYQNPSHTREQRCDQWLEINAQLGRDLDWSGLEDHHKWMWQRQLHIFCHPLYYIEYGIAQLGALGLWVRSRREGESAAVDAYIKALSLGGSKPLPQLFEAAGLDFDFGEQTVSKLVREVETFLDELG